MNILVAIDLSESSQIVVEQAKKLAESLSAKIWLLHVANLDPDLSFLPVGSSEVTYHDAGEIRGAVAKKFHNEHRLLQQFSRELRSSGFDCTALLIEGTTTDTILKEVDKLAVEMVILGSQRKGAVDRFLLGSTGEDILNKSPVPILIVPTHNRHVGKVNAKRDSC